MSTETPKCFYQADSKPESFVDPEDLQAKNLDFSEESVRRGFIRKVYSILMVQLLITLSFVAAIVYVPALNKFFTENCLILLFLGIAGFILVFYMTNSESARREYPKNMIVLGIFTLVESLIVGAIAGSYSPDTVVLAVGITAILCLTLTIFAMQTKYDFTVMGGILLICLVCLLILGIVGIFWTNRFMDTVYAVFGAILMCFMIIFDTQKMMGGRHKYSISPEEYVFAALCLFLDIINLFLFILRLVGRRK